MHRAVQRPPNFPGSPTVNSGNWANWLNISRVPEFPRAVGYRSKAPLTLFLKGRSVSWTLRGTWDQAPHCADTEGQAQLTVPPAGGPGAAVGLVVVGRIFPFPGTLPGLPRRELRRAGGLLGVSDTSFAEPQDSRRWARLNSQLIKAMSISGAFTNPGTLSSKYDVKESVDRSAALLAGRRAPSAVSSCLPPGFSAWVLAK